MMNFHKKIILITSVCFIACNKAMENNALIKTEKEKTKIEFEKDVWLFVGKVIEFESYSSELCGDHFYKLDWHKYGYIKERVCINGGCSDPDYYTLIPLLKIEARGVCSGRLLTRRLFDRVLYMRHITSDEAHNIFNAIKKKKAEFSRVYEEDPDFSKILQYLEYEKNKA